MVWVQRLELSQRLFCQRSLPQRALCTEMIHTRLSLVTKSSTIFLPSSATIHVKLPANHCPIALLQRRELAPD